MLPKLWGCQATRDTKRCCWCWLAAPYWETDDGPAVLAVTAALVGLPGADAGTEGLVHLSQVQSSGR